MICCLAVPSPAMKLWRSLRFLAVGMLRRSLPSRSTSVLLSLSTMFVPPLPRILLWWLAKSSSRQPRESLAQLQNVKKKQSLKMEIPKNPGSKRNWSCVPHLQPGTHISWYSKDSYSSQTVGFILEIINFLVPSKYRQAQTDLPTSSSTINTKPNPKARFNMMTSSTAPSPDPQLQTLSQSTNVTQEESLPSEHTSEDARLNSCL